MKKNKGPKPEHLLSERVQLILWVLGISWHNKYRGECTPDFSCCCKPCKLPLWKRLNQIGIYWR